MPVSSCKMWIKSASTNRQASIDCWHTLRFKGKCAWDNMQTTGYCLRMIARSPVRANMHVAVQTVRLLLYSREVACDFADWHAIPVLSHIAVVCEPAKVLPIA